jgi:hypothetical protein
MLLISPPAQARAARAITEAALDAAGWPYTCGLSRHIDQLLVLEEGAP